MYSQQQSSACGSDARLVEALQRFIPQVMRQQGTPGLNIALARHGRVIWEQGFGFADLVHSTPYSPHTVMHSGSMGKVYTATAVMQLVESRVIGLYDPINKYLKAFQVTNPLGEREITFYDLLTHRSGLSPNEASSDFVPGKPLGEHLREEYTTHTMMEPYDRSLVPRWGAKVGRLFQYSNFGMATLGYLVEGTNPEGLSFSDYVQQHIMDPLGMTSSQYPPVQDAAHVKPGIYSHFSTGYATIGAVALPTPTIYFADFPAGTVVTTPGDHIQIGMAYLNDGTYNGYRLLAPETVRFMLTPQAAVLSRVPTAQVGLVWHLVNGQSENRSYGHGGAHMFGWRNGLHCFPEQDFALVVATNHWPMLMATAADPGLAPEDQVIAEFISTWLRREDKTRHHRQHVDSEPWQPLYAPAGRSSSNSRWAWKVSYMIGLVMAERIKGSLGIPSPLTPDMVEGMAQGAYVRAGTDRASLWDPDGFRAGAHDMIGTTMTPGAVQAFLESDRLQVPFEELGLLYRQLGSSGAPIIGGILDTTYQDRPASA